MAESAALKSMVDSLLDGVATRVVDQLKPLLTLCAVQAEPKLLLSREEAADLLSISPRTVDSLIEDGKLTPMRIGARVLLRRADLEAFCAPSVAPAGSADVSIDTSPCTCSIPVPGKGAM